MYKGLVHLGFALLYVLVLFFGLGPVLLADGASSGRIASAAVALIAAVILAAIQIWLMRRMK